MHNVHTRTIEAPADRVGALLDRLGGPDDRWWPSPAWVPMRLDQPLQVGASGGHGPIRYRVTEHHPGRLAEFTFTPATGLEGTHTFTVTPLGPDRCRLRHEIRAEPRGAMKLRVPVAVRPLHDAVLEDLLDNAEQVATGTVRDRARWSPWVRLLHLALGADRPRGVPIPQAAALARAAFDHTDLADAWQIRLRPGHPTDPQVWADGIFRDPPAWVSALLGLRDQLVPLIGIQPSDDDDFATVDRTEDEVLLGTDAGQLDFRASLLVDGATVTLSTVARHHSAVGRCYLAGVRLAHPVIVRSMLRRAARRLATPRPGRRAGATAPQRWRAGPGGAAGPAAAR